MRRLIGASKTACWVLCAWATGFGATASGADAGRVQPGPNRPPPIFFSSDPRQPGVEILFWSDRQPLRECPR